MECVLVGNCLLARLARRPKVSGDVLNETQLWISEPRAARVMSVKQHHGSASLSWTFVVCVVVTVSRTLRELQGWSDVHIFAHVGSEGLLEWDNEKEATEGTMNVDEGAASENRLLVAARGR